MKKIGFLPLIFLTVIVSISGCASSSHQSPSLSDGNAQVNTITVSAASSLTNALEEIKLLYEKNNKDLIQFNFGGSGALQKQIEEGAPCDLYISAALVQMDYLEEQDLLLEESRVNLLGNELVLICAKEVSGKIFSSKALTSDLVKSIAIGVPETVPSGKYAKQTLMDLDLWDGTQSKLVLAKDVKQVLEYVETGNVDCGFVYRTDALTLKTAALIEENFSASHESILYPAALLKNSDNTEAAQNFYDFLKSKTAMAVFEKYGFNINPPQ